MKRDEMQLRDRLLMFAESSNPHKPFNVKRKTTLTKQPSKTGPKLSVQDFVRMDPGYTPDIEHLVFPMRKRNPQQVAPINPPPSKTRSRLAEMFALSRHLQQKSTDKDSKRNSIINRSVDSVLDPSPLRNSRAVTSETARRWVSSVEEPTQMEVRKVPNTGSASLSQPSSRQNSISTKISPAADADMIAANRESNVSVLHLRSTSNPWETTTICTNASSTTYSGKNYFARRTASSLPPLTKYQSMGGPSSAYKWQNSPSFHVTADVNTTEMIIGNTKRELSPVRWYNREVDGVYLNKSGWVQVEQRSLDESKRFSAADLILPPPKRTSGKLSDYHFNSEPATERPSALSFQTTDYNRKSASPSPPLESPSVTPIISPPPAFQDRIDKGFSKKSRTFFGKTPFLPRSNAIEDSDASPPSTPQRTSSGKSPPSPLWNPGGKPIPSPQWKTTKSNPCSLWNSKEKPPASPKWKSVDNGPPSPLWNARKSPPSPLWQRSREKSPPSPLWTQNRKSPPSPLWKMSGKPPPSVQRKGNIQPQSRARSATSSPAVEMPNKTVSKIPQTKSLEETTLVRRNQFLQHYRGSSSSSSSSMGFRSLDSNFNRPGNIMPRLSENTDSSIDHHADEEDNNSSSINISVLPITISRDKVSKTPSQTIRDKTNTAQSREKDRISPSGRSNRLHHRSQLRRSPAGSESNKTLNSSSSSSEEFLSRSPTGSSLQQANRRQSSAKTGYQPSRASLQEDSTVRVRRSRSLQLPEKKPQTLGRDLQQIQARISPQHSEHRAVVKFVNSGENIQTAHSLPHSLEGGEVTEEMLREAEVVTGFIYGKRSRAAAQALLNQRFSSCNISKEDKNKAASKSTNNGVTVYYVPNSKKDGQKVLVRGATSPIFSTDVDSRQDVNELCSMETCNYWPHCTHRDTGNVIRPSYSYPTHQRSLDSSRPSLESKTQERHKRRLALEMERRKQNCMSTNESHERPTFVTERRTSPNKAMKRDLTNSRKTSPNNPKSHTATFGTVSGSSSGSDVLLTASMSLKNSVKSSGMSLSRDEAADDNVKIRETIITRPGSAPSDQRDDNTLEMQQRSMSLPKSFLSASYKPTR